MEYKFSNLINPEDRIFGVYLDQGKLDVLRFSVTDYSCENPNLNTKYQGLIKVPFFELSDEKGDAFLMPDSLTSENRILNTPINIHRVTGNPATAPFIIWRAESFIQRLLEGSNFEMLPTEKHQRLTELNKRLLCRFAKTICIAKYMPFEKDSPYYIKISCPISF